MISDPVSSNGPVIGRDGRVAEGARLESVFRGNSNVGSNPTLSAKPYTHKVAGLLSLEIY
jgi:hypothetical protein